VIAADSEISAQLGVKDTPKKTTPFIERERKSDGVEREAIVGVDQQQALYERLANGFREKDGR
jgi:hypothetical protein